MKAFVTIGTPLYIYFDDAAFAAAHNGGGVKMMTTLAKAWHNVRVGDRLYLNDGKIAAQVVKVHERHVEAKVVADGGKRKAIKQGTGIHLPDSFLHLTVPPSPTTTLNGFRSSLAMPISLGCRSFRRRMICESFIICLLNKGLVLSR